METRCPKCGHNLIRRNNIKNIRVFLGETQKEFSARLGVAQNTLAVAENGTQGIPERYYDYFRTAFGVSREMVSGETVFRPTKKLSLLRAEILEGGK